MSEKPDVKVALATFEERLIAGLIDYGIVYGAFIVGAILQTILQITLSSIPFIGILIGLVFYIVGLAAFFYVFVYMPYKQDGKTFGKKNKNIKLMFIDDEAKWTLRPVQEGDLGQLFIRAIVGAIEATWIPVIIAWYFITQHDKNRQRLADQLAKTVVVQCDPETGEPLKKPRVAEKKKE
jgi:uncharacterized RDD family membrane protein YckC